MPEIVIPDLPHPLRLEQFRKALCDVVRLDQIANLIDTYILKIVSLAKLEVFSENMRQVKFTLENLEEFLEMPELPQPEKRADIRHTDVALRNVRFSYTGEEKDEVLHGIDMTLPEGSFTALVGPSGGGKSTVAKLIARFWDVTSGAITIGGVNVKDMPLSQLSEYVSFVTQDNFLFRCSLLENIRLGNPNATDEEVKAAARAAQCEEFISKLPQGYDTPAGEAGKRLSGGEKQRIAIARMMLKNAPIVILDEATAFTDPENEDKIQRSIAALTRGKTLLVIAHRLSTIKNADNIVVLKNGAIVAQGTQEQLLETCPLYQDMWRLSHRREELGGIHRRKGGVNHVQDCKTYHRLVRRIQGQAVSGLRHDLLLPHFRRHAAGAGRLHRGLADRVPAVRNALRHLVDLEMHRHSGRTGAAPLPL